jgi:hypothetical protein
MIREDVEEAAVSLHTNEGGAQLETEIQKNAQINNSDWDVLQGGKLD